MNFKNISKVFLPVGAALLTLAASVVSEKNREAQMNEAITKKVAEALSEKAKEL